MSSAKPLRQRPGGGTTILIAQPESLVPKVQPSPVELAPSPALPQVRAKEARVKRSIQLDAAIADQYDEQVLILHATLRVPKNRIHDAMLTIALEHLDEVQACIKDS